MSSRSLSTGRSVQSWTFSAIHVVDAPELVVALRGVVARCQRAVDASPR